MLVREYETYGLDHERQVNDADSSDLKEAADLLFKILDSSYCYSGNSLETEVNGTKKNIQELYGECKRQLEQTSLCPEETGFLALSVIEKTYRQCLPLCLCPLQYLLDGDDGMLQDARKLEQILNKNPWKKRWEKQAGRYLSTLSFLGFSVNDFDFHDLTKIMEPLMDALSFYNKPTIFQVRSGENASGRKPDIAKAVCLYRSEKELVDAVMQAGKECLIVFGAVEKTNRQINDWFYEWFHGFPDERQRNFKKYDHMTTEEYLDAAAEYTRSLYACVKSGRNCYLVSMPIKRDNYGTIDQAHTYYYGKKAWYAPFEIFYKEAAPAPEGSTMLAVPKKGYLLSELMDEQSAAWLPAFLDKTIQYFFKNEGRKETKTMILPEEMAAVLGNETDPQNYAVVPVNTGLPALCTYKYQIKNPEELFEEEWMHALFARFCVTAEDIRNIPILPQKMNTEEYAGSDTTKKCRQAYTKILAERIADYMEVKRQIREELVRYCTSHETDIIYRAGTGQFMDFMKPVIHGAQVFDNNGNPVFVKQDHYPYEQVPLKEKTTWRDSEGNNCPDAFETMCFWSGPTTAKNPPVVWKIRPKRPEHYAVLWEKPVAGLPELLQISDKLNLFYETYKHALPNNMTCKYSTAGYKSIYMPPMCDINICMMKKQHNSYPAFAKTKKRKEP